MRINDLVQEMSQMYLQRILESFTKDFPKTDLERTRELIITNQKELTDKSRIKIQLSSIPTFSDQILVRYIFESLVNKSDYLATEEEILNDVIEVEGYLLGLSEDPDAFKYEDQFQIEILKAVLGVALEDDHLSTDELKLIERLKAKLKISDRATMMILAKLNHFPRQGNHLHDLQDVKTALKELQKKGLVFFCNSLNYGVYVVPEELVGPIKETLGIELNQHGSEMLLDSMSVKMLSDILVYHNLPKSGSKQELKDRFIQSGIRPSEAMNALSNEDLYDLCKKLPGAKVSGTKQEKANRIIDYFSNLLIKEVDESMSPGELYFQYYNELAARDRENLQANKVIKKDIDMERYFEEATRYLFTVLLGHELEEMSGSDHPDGCIRSPKSNSVFLWDNKSKESEYSFPASHIQQFKRYIRDSEDRVSCFLVIVPSAKVEANLQATKLKFESGSGTDVCVIAAEDLKWLAEEWSQTQAGKKLNLNVFSKTGILERQEIKQRLKILA